MREESFYDHLCNDLIPFWNNMKDEEHGGFYGYADDHGVADKNSMKGAILNSRILWFYSASYKLLKNEGLLRMADHAYNFLVNYFFDHRYGGIFWSVNADGSVLDDVKHTYNLAFSVYALSVYYQVSGRKDALNLAYTLYRTIEEKCRDEKGYLEAFNRDFTPVFNDKLSENGVLADRTMNTLLHVLESYTELYRADGFSNVGKSIREILQIFKTKIYNPQRKICEVFFDKEYNSIINLESYGHDIETSWLIDRACDVLRDEKCHEEMLPIINGLAAEAYINGIDPQSHAMYNECENGVISRKKIWWVQAEAVIGFYNAYQKNPNHTEYMYISQQIWDYINKNVIDTVTGEWIEDIEPDNTVKPNQALVHAWKCPYHNGRMCIEMINRLRQTN
ncbi:mannobiose 2-epimerase [Eubacterium ruminantium]|uniref:Cellobiose 2-epimerase n=1 Tax=Eubacterium ruminantium TaxID=42322 RepID=A0A1T4KTN4_9FIRM|nr:mannobiose 2-epimerase [Eubacterium ruminantium]SDM33574.1 mannobiose 2-epimerase [Eubacterium ruminantium]SJZ45766.1 mannobiose 2-epimerase [Eubacterium ruminantium]